jgi:hypothetical protein
VHGVESHRAGLGKHTAHELALTNAAPRDLLAKGGRRIAIGAQRSGHVALVGEALQESLPMRPEPIRQMLSPCE